MTRRMVASAVAGAAVLGFSLSAWMGNRAICPGCSSSDVQLALADATPIFGRLYWPARSPSGPLAVVIVCHGYLANLGFMEIPWAADLTRLGVAAFLLDRRGHGWSGGTWWPRRAESVALDDLEEDIAAAISYVRSLAPRIDPGRVALLGHSDGATAAIVAASADWQVRATAALSASVAPSHFVNHAAPRNLLLLYGEADSFVLGETDRMLIASATRGYLTGAGQMGDMADGGARRLVRVPGAGHVQLLHNAVARRAALEWLRDSLQAPGEVRLSPLRHGWFAGGYAALLALVAAWPHTGSWSTTEWRSRKRPYTTVASPADALSGLFHAGALLAAWPLGLAIAAWISRRARVVPSQEGAVVAAVLVAESVVLVVLFTLRGIVQRVTGLRSATQPTTASGSPDLAPTLRSHLVAIAGGCAFGALTISAVQLLVAHLYEGPVSGPRLGLAALFTVLALPAFVLLDRWLTLVEVASSPAPSDRGGSAAATRWLWRSATTLMLLAAVTAVGAGALFERMAVFPVYLLAATLPLLAAYRIGRPGRPGLAAAGFAAVIIGRAASAVCALY